MNTTADIDPVSTRFLKATELLKGLSVIILSLISQELHAQKSNVVSQTIKALGKTPVVRELVREKKYKVDHQIKQFTEFLGDNAGIIIAAGVITKLAIDGRAKYKAKISKNTNYDISLDVSGEVSSGISGKIEGLKDSSYDLTAYSKSGDQGMKAGLSFSFD